MFYYNQTVAELVSVAIVTLLRNSLLIGPAAANKLILMLTWHKVNRTGVAFEPIVC